jgi:hypothetical protein
MSDLETRLRDALAEDVGATAPDEMLRAVRRGAALRRGRRAVVAVALTVAVIVVGSAALQHGHTRRTPEPVRTPSTCAHTCTPAPHGRVVDLVAAGDHVFRLSVHDGCTHCGTVSERTASGQWDRLGELQGGSREWGPVQRLLMSPNGRDGWAWQGQLWSTHDGGRTWTQVTTGPGRPTIRGHQVAVGSSYAWSVFTSGDGPELWRTPLGSDHWQRVRAPAAEELVGVVPDGRVVLHDTGEGASGAVVVVEDTTRWQRYPQPFTSDYRFVLGGSTVYARHGSSLSELTLGTDGQPTWRSVPRLPPGFGDGLLSLDSEYLLMRGAAGWYLRTPGGTVRTDLPHSYLVAGSTDSAGTAWVITIRGRIYSSTDATHWAAQP